MMIDSGSRPKVLRFGEFEVDLPAGHLLKNGAKIRLREQVFVVLSVLLEHAGEVVAREEIQRRLWPGDVVVDFEINLNTIIAQLRQALGDSAGHPHYIETLPKRGYRFLAPVSEGPAAGPVPPRRVRLIILPFSNESGDPAEEHFSDAMTDELITSLCKVAPEQLAVIARTTAMHYKSTKKDVAHIGRELGADYVVEGGVHRSDGRVAMNVQLVQAGDQAHVFAEKYEAELGGLFGLLGRVAEDIAGHIPSLPGLGAGGPARKKPTEDLEAYQLYLQGRRYMLSLTPESIAKGKRCFEEAIARDPKFGLAYDGLGELYWWTGFFGYLPPKQASFEGLGAVLRAVEIDPTLGETHALLGQFRQKVDYNWPEVLREMTLARELDPSSPLVRARYAVSYLMPHGRLDEAIAQVEKGLEIDPLSWVLNLWQAIFLWLARDSERGLRAARFFEELDPGAWGPKFVVASVLRDGGRFEEALAYQKRAVELSGGAPQMLGFLALNWTRLGKTAEARSLLERLRAISTRTYVSPSSLAWAHVGLGEYDEALERLGQAIDERDSMIVPIKTYPFLDPLRPDPRFAALIRKMNLEP